TLYAQTPVELQIKHKLGSSDFAFSTATTNSLGNNFNVTRLEYYISKISITHDGGTVTNIPNHYILANGSTNVADALGSYPITSVQSISFYIGVDAPINNADPSLQPAGHPLAPKSPSMHWGWSAGYRFVAMEGMAGTSLGQPYEVHALGNSLYNATTVNVAGTMIGGKLVIALNADYTQALRGINVSSGLIAHGSGSDEAAVLNNFKNYVFSAGTAVSVVGVAATNNSVVVFPNPAHSGSTTLSFGNALQSGTITITDLQGRVVMTTTKKAGESNVNISLKQTGFYFVKAQMADGSIATNKLIIE
ncbi:MAG: T9SS type A sorting domain-containing protein, partial [Taibaiella sp.]|nr:T9SS type A sorting domain-containing protein [Taibaiella sp.]